MENIALTLENVTGKGLGFKLKDISAKFENGYIYAITGKNGAGKTTLFNYILAQRKRYTGSIKMSGYELERNHSKAMEIMGFVSEDNVFFENRTGKQNADILGLVYDDFDVELFNECMKKMNVSTATTLWRMSRGERMKFQLAFAIAHHSRLYLLDEATASLDVENETLIQTALSRLIKDKTVIVIAHRMRTIENADKIIVLANGTVAESGTPNELMNKNGLFRHMVELQTASQNWTI